MNAEILLKGLSLLGDEPETIQHLRKLVIALSVAGRLRSSNFDGDPDSFKCFIEKGGNESQQVESSRIESGAANASIDNLPEGFTNHRTFFVRLASIARVEKGKTGIKQAEPGPYPLVVTAEKRATCSHFDFDGTAAIIPLVSSAGHGKASLQRLHYQEGKFALGTILAAVFPMEPRRVSARFLYEYLSAFKDELLISKMIGTANVSLSISKISDVPVPFLSPSEQRQVDELMVLCDRLEATRVRREATRDRLAGATFARLGTRDSETFPVDARFALDTLPALTARPNQINYLRQQLLDLAFQGSLRGQRPSPYSTAENAINSEERRWEIEEVQQPSLFAIPSTWRWYRIGDVLSEMLGGVSTSKSDYVDHGVLVFNKGNVRTFGCTEFGAVRNYVTDEFFARHSSRAVLPGDMVVALRDFSLKADFLGLIGEYSLPKPALLSQGACIVRLARWVVPRFLMLYSNTTFYRSIVKTNKIGTTQVHLRNGQFGGIPIPMPATEEQHRIVVMLDELMTLCGRLEASLVSSEEIRKRLLDALLADVLGPTAARDVEAVA